MQMLSGMIPSCCSEEANGIESIVESPMLKGGLPEGDVPEGEVVSVERIDLFFSDIEMNICRM